MRTIGIRAGSSFVTFAVFDANENRIVNVETINIPVALDTPDSLRYIRNTVLDLLREYSIERACIRETEPTAQSSNIQRIQIEAVIQESFASSSLTAYFVGQISSISSRIGIHRADFKPYVSGEKNLDEVEDWASFDKEEREAILAALGARNA
ncbi:hypothetical protein [Steroidobacter agaridevorans]|uniref:hypothetical protein n=1 Tax=Steroidobacter agaridevorans TaxID=2695856 RepID=UPI0018E58A1F|nr:hypothetical protein [Steroidobacter agaridevorans]